jgi:hypothetical protein
MDEFTKNGWESVFAINRAIGSIERQESHKLTPEMLLTCARLRACRDKLFLLFGLED